MRIYSFGSTYSIDKIQNTGKDLRTQANFLSDDCYPYVEREVILSQTTYIDSSVAKGCVSSPINSLKKEKQEYQGCHDEGI